MIRANSKLIKIILSCILCFLFTCLMGGSAEQGNARISGCVVNSDGQNEVPAFTELYLVPYDYNPFDTGSAVVFYTQTDELGNYQFDRIPSGTYYLYARNYQQTLSLLKGPIQLDLDHFLFRTDTLKKSASVTVKLSDKFTNTNTGFYIKGTTDKFMVSDTEHVSISNAPSGVHDVMAYAPEIAQTPVIYTEKLTIIPADTILVSYRNRPPQFITSHSDLPAQLLYDTMFFGSLKFFDPDSDAIRISVISPPENFKIDSVSGDFNWLPSRTNPRASSIKFVISDEAGASSNLWWTPELVSVDSTPEINPPFGPQFGIVDSSYTFKADSIFCSTSPLLFRFSWGDGDTSEWSTAPVSEHIWRNAGFFSIQVQVNCTDFNFSSKWSAPLNIEITNMERTAKPEMNYSGDTISIFLYDSVNVTVNASPCQSITYYSFFLTDSAYQGWSESPQFTFYPPSAGLYQLRVSAWCDTATLLPSELSDPLIIQVHESDTLSPPLLQGDTTYIINTDTALLSFNIQGDTCFTDSQHYQFSICNNGHELTTDSIIFNYSKNREQFATELISTTECDTTVWYSCDKIDIQIFKPSGVFLIGIRTKCSNSVPNITGWSYITITGE